MNRDFFVKVKNTTREGKELFGTAYPVGPDLLLTCGHVVLGKEKIEVQWQISDPKESVPDCEYVDHKSWRKIKNVPWIGDDPVDAALIRVDGMPKVAMQRPGRLQAERLPRTLPFESIGFPKAHQFEWKAIAGTASPGPGQANRYDLTVEQNPNNAEDWGGISGCPVFINGWICGVTAWWPKGFNGRSLEAVTSACLLDDPDFLSDSGLGNRTLPLEDVHKGVLSILEGCTSLHANLAKELKCPLEEVASQLTNLPVDSFMRLINQGHNRAAGVKAALADGYLALMCFLLPHVFQPHVSGGLAAKLDGALGGFFPLPMKRPQLFELILAGAAKRSAAFDVGPIYPVPTSCLGATSESSGIPLLPFEDGGSPEMFKQRFLIGIMQRVLGLPWDEERNLPTDLVEDAAAAVEVAAQTGVYWYFTFSFHKKEAARYTPVLEELVETFPEITFVMMEPGGGKIDLVILRIINEILKRNEPPPNAP